MLDIVLHCVVFPFLLICPFRSKVSEQPQDDNFALLELDYRRNSIPQEPEKQVSVYQKEPLSY